MNLAHRTRPRQRRACGASAVMTDPKPRLREATAARLTELVEGDERGPAEIGAAIWRGATSHSSGIRIRRAMADGWRALDTLEQIARGLGYKIEIRIYKPAAKRAPIPCAAQIRPDPGLVRELHETMASTRATLAKHRGLS